MRTVLFIIQKEFLQIFRNRTMLPIIFVVPVVQLLVLAFAATFDIQNTDIMVVDHDKSPASRELVRKFDGSNFFTIVGYPNDVAEAKEALLLSQTHQVLVIEPGFGSKLNKEGKAKVQLLNDAVDGNAASLRNAYATSIIRDFNNKLIAEAYPLLGKPELIQSSWRFWFNPELNYKTYMVPGILVLLVTVIALFLSGMNIVREKEIGTIEQINVTPIKRWQFISGKLIPFWVIALFELAFGLVVAKIAFDIPMLGSLWLVFGFAAVYLMVILGIGLFISTITETQQQAMFIAWFFAIIFILLSGLFTPVESMPDWAQKLNIINPIAYFIEVMRMILLKGSRFSDIAYQFTAICIYAVLMLGLAVNRYKKKA